MKQSNLSLFLLTTLITLLPFNMFAQSPLSGNKPTFTRADSLRGSLRPERTWFDVTFYDLNIKVDPDKQTIEGFNTIHFLVNESFPVMQLDLFDNLNIDSIVYKDRKLGYKREFNAVFIEMGELIKPGEIEELTFYYSGTPTVAIRAPWDGGFVWNKDKNGNHFVGVACQGFGASSWWPTKDHQSDEPDSMRIAGTVPSNLVMASNGRLRSTVENGDWTTYEWFVSYPINNYNASITIADFANFNDTYVSETEGTLDLRYYVLSYNLEKAKKQFEQVPPMMACYEEWLGPYPFWRDGFALIETPYLGMEHQSGIAYGNDYLTGYAGTDFSRIGLTFDYIIIHEAGHEWWGNNLTSFDIGDMWIHEGFCTYTESLYVECMFGYEKAMDYVNAKKPTIGNREPVQGPYGVNHEGNGDMYNKGMLMLNTVRHAVGNDDLWHEILKGLQTDYKYSIVTRKDIIEYINEKTGKDFSHIFAQYLDYTSVPQLQFKTTKKGKNLMVDYRWEADAVGFDLPFKYKDNTGEWQTIYPTSEWQSMKLKKMKEKNLEWAMRDFYVVVKNVGE
ncbi:MAG: M1 family metallopeptidase [Chitinophagales bacterium]